MIFNKHKRLVSAKVQEKISRYNRSVFLRDSLAAIIVTMMLIPQALAYALLAGMPAQMGLYASILPLVVYAVFGSSRTLSIGPVALVSLMTAAAVGKLPSSLAVDPVSAAIALSMMSGVVLLCMGLLRFGFLANFMSHPVISGFITGSAIIIGLSQFRHILGVDAQGNTVLELLVSLSGSVMQTNFPTALTGGAAIVFLIWSKIYAQSLLQRLGVASRAAALVSKACPVVVIAVGIALSYYFIFPDIGIAVVGTVPQQLPNLQLPSNDYALYRELFYSALLIAIIGFVESVSIGKTLAAKRREHIVPNRELTALGAANMASSVSGGFPVAAGFSRSIVNFEAGAETPVASVLAAVGVAFAALYLTPILFFLPKAILAATIIVAISSLIDLAIVKRAWQYSHSDFIAVLTTIISTLLLGVELGVLAGIVVSLCLHLYKTSRPHIAIVGAVSGTEHFRNVERHNVITHPNLISLRVDESLYFANVSYLEDYVYQMVARSDAIEHVILQCTAINEIDLTALEVLESILQHLDEHSITLNLSEVKGPVMDSLKKSCFLNKLSGNIYLTHHQAVKDLKLDEIEPYLP